METWSILGASCDLSDVGAWPSLGVYKSHCTAVRHPCLPVTLAACQPPLSSGRGHLVAP